MPEIHSTALVSPDADVAPDVRIGPYAIVEPRVRIGPGTSIGAGAYICSGTTIGERNDIHMYAVIGHTPQDVHFEGHETFCEIGDGNAVREFVTIHRGTQPGSTTRVGSGCMLMATSHVAHNCILGDGVILANGALLAGHVEVGANAFVSGHALVHQFVRIGRLAMVAGGARVSRDVPPFCLMSGESLLHGVNRVGIRRAGLAREAVAGIGRAYRALFMSDDPPDEAARALLAGDTASPCCPPVQTAVSADRQAHGGVTEAHEMAEFVLAAKRGVCRASGRRRSAPPKAGLSADTAGGDGMDACD